MPAVSLSFRHVQVVLSAKQAVAKPGPRQCRTRHLILAKEEYREGQKSPARLEPECGSLQHNLACIAETDLSAPAIQRLPLASQAGLAPTS